MAPDARKVPPGLWNSVDGELAGLKASRAPRGMSGLEELNQGKGDQGPHWTNL